MQLKSGILIALLHNDFEHRLHSTEKRLKSTIVKQAKIMYKTSTNQMHIDLHGMSLVTGKACVIKSIEQAIDQKFFCIKIITGRGVHASDKNTSRGVFFKKVPMWINHMKLREHVNCIIKEVGSYNVILNNDKYDSHSRYNQDPAIYVEEKRFMENLYLNQSKLIDLIKNPASAKKNLEITKIIRSNPLLLEKISCDGTTILMVAAALNQIKTMEFLLEYDNSNSIQPRLLKKSREDGTNALMIAVMFEHIASIDFLLNKAPSLLKMKQKNGTSIIQIAANTGNSKIVLDALYQHLKNHHRQKGYTNLFREYKSFTRCMPIIESNDFKRYKSEHAWFFYDRMSLFLQKVKQHKSKTPQQIIRGVRFLNKDLSNKTRPQKIKLKKYKFKNPKWIKKINFSKEEVIQRFKQRIIFLLQTSNIFRKWFLRFNNSKKIEYNRHFKHAVDFSFLNINNIKKHKSAAFKKRIAIGCDKSANYQQIKLLKQQEKIKKDALKHNSKMDLTTQCKELSASIDRIDLPTKKPLFFSSTFSCNTNVWKDRCIDLSDKSFFKSVSASDPLPKVVELDQKVASQKHKVKSNSFQKPHREDLCELCQKLGRSCALIMEMARSLNYIYQRPDVRVKGLPNDITEKKIKKMFVQYGVILRVSILEQNPTFPTRIAFITFSDPEAALQKFNNFERTTSKLGVTEAVIGRHLYKF